jgi:V/A-type H+-transporting ATPase subunit D
VIALPVVTGVRPTRMEYLRVKRRIAMAKKGLKLLKLKRQALILEFFSLSKAVAALRADLLTKVVDAYNSVHMAEMLVGPMRLEYEAMRIPKVAGLALKTKNVMGVKIPAISSNPISSDSAEYLLELPASVNQVIRSFRELNEMVLQVAEKETALRKLLLEIEKTKRRSNAIENILIPRLEQAAAYIKFMFDEMERENFTRLKKVKAKRVEFGNE